MNSKAHLILWQTDWQIDFFFRFEPIQLISSTQKHPSSIMLAEVALIRNKQRILHLTLVFFLLIGDGSGCKSASLGQSIDLSHSENQMVNISSSNNS